MKTGKQLDVLIVGAGPTGTSLAIDLVRRGLSVRIVDKAAGAFQGSRAKGLQPRTLEVLYDLGALDDVMAGGSEYPLLGIHFGSLTLPWRMFRSTRPSADVPFPYTWLIPQYLTDQALRTRLEHLGSSIEYDRELVKLRQAGESVIASVSGPQGSEEITARYLVGADGGSSAVRTQLGIDFRGSTDEQDRIVVLDAVVTGLSRDRWHIWPGARGRFVGACPLPHSDLFQWMIRLRPGEDPPRDLAETNKRIQARIDDPRVELKDIRWRSVFRPNIRLAKRYRVGRVLIAGDAAHVHTPAGAQGLNTGVQDAYNLGWKLAQVLAGAPEALLDSYEAERRPIAAHVLGLSTKKYEGIAKLAPSSMRRGKDEQQLALTYFGGPLAPIESQRTNTLRVGDRAPDAALSRPSGDPVRLFELYRGPHFTAIASGACAATALEGIRWPPVGAPLQRIIVGAGSHSADELADPSRAFRRTYGLKSEALLLIRPDGYIGQIATSDMLARTQAAVQAMAPQ